MFSAFDYHYIQDIIQKAEWLHEFSDTLPDRVAIELPSTIDADMGEMEWILFLIWRNDGYKQADCSFRHLADETLSIVAFYNRYDIQKMKEKSNAEKRAVLKSRQQQRAWLIFMEAEH